MGSVPRSPKIKLPKIEMPKLPTPELPTLEEITKQLSTPKVPELPTWEKITEPLPTLGELGENIKETVGKAGEDIKREVGGLELPTLGDIGETIGKAGEDIKREVGGLELPSLDLGLPVMKWPVFEDIKRILGTGSKDVEAPVSPREPAIPTEDKVEEEAKKAREFENIRLSGLVGRQSTIKKKKLGAISTATETILGR